VSEVPGDVTVLLRRLNGGDDAARKLTYDRLISLVYDELRLRAREQMRREQDWHTLQATALVHEAYERLIQYDMDYANRSHFLNVAAAAMRRLLVDHARNRKASKRWGDLKRTLIDGDITAVAAAQQRPEELIDLDRAVQSLSPEQIKLVELRYFLGLTVEETADIMQIQVETLKKRWRVVKLLLYDKLKGA
jgi:RNA polymerase sigma factor (TIGR02999 family)